MILPSVPCPYCRRTEFVRTMKVIQGPVVTREYVCGACDRSWTTADGHLTAKGQPPSVRKSSAR